MLEGSKLVCHAEGELIFNESVTTFLITIETIINHPPPLPSHPSSFFALAGKIFEQKRNFLQNM